MCSILGSRVLHKDVMCGLDGVRHRSLMDAYSTTCPDATRTTASCSTQYYHNRAFTAKQTSNSSHEANGIKNTCLKFVLKLVYLQQLLCYVHLRIRRAQENPINADINVPACTPKTKQTKPSDRKQLLY
jgi:hypothetical protein